MNNRTHKYLWILVALAVAMLPLRGALALPALSDTLSHCMQQVQADLSAGQSNHGCDHDCSGDHCAGACSAHVPVSAALTGFIALAADTPEGVTETEYFHSFTGYTAHPPFRPPIFFS